MYYVHGLAWEAYYKGGVPTEKAFDTAEDAEAYRSQMQEEHPEANWSMSTRSLYGESRGDTPW